MIKWGIIKINNNSKYDFRLIPSINNNFSDVNFFKHSFFRILVSLSSYLTDGIISDNNNIFYQVISNNKGSNFLSTIFNFTIDKYKGTSIKYLTLNNKITKLIFYENNLVYNITLLQLPDTKIFSSLFTYQTINNINNFLQEHNKAYSHIISTSSNIYLTTGYLQSKKLTSLIIDLLVYDKKFRTRY